MPQLGSLANRITLEGLTSQYVSLENALKRLHPPHPRQGNPPARATLLGRVAFYHVK